MRIKCLKSSHHVGIDALSAPTNTDQQTMAISNRKESCGDSWGQGWHHVLFVITVILTAHMFDILPFLIHFGTLCWYYFLRRWAVKVFRVRWLCIDTLYKCNPWNSRVWLDLCCCLNLPLSSKPKEIPQQGRVTHWGQFHSRCQTCRLTEEENWVVIFRKQPLTRHKGKYGLSESAVFSYVLGGLGWLAVSRIKPL